MSSFKQFVTILLIILLVLVLIVLGYHVSDPVWYYLGILLVAVPGAMFHYHRHGKGPWQ